MTIDFDATIDTGTGAEGLTLTLADPSAGATALGAGGAGEGFGGIKGIAVPLMGNDGERHVAHVLPLTSGARRRAGITYTAAAALFVRKAALAALSPFEVIGKTFKLTPTELRVLLAIVVVVVTIGFIIYYSQQG